MDPVQILCHTILGIILYQTHLQTIFDRHPHTKLVNKQQMLGIVKALVVHPQLIFSPLLDTQIVKIHLTRMHLHQTLGPQLGILMIQARMIQIFEIGVPQVPNVLISNPKVPCDHVLIVSLGILHLQQQTRSHQVL